MSGIPKTTLKQKISLIAFGIILSLVLLEITLRLCGVFFLLAQARRNKIVLERWGEFRILCLGESTTTEGGWDSYPRQLGRLLRQQMPDKKISIINRGVVSITTAEILSLLPRCLDEYAPQMVIVMMGINDRESSMSLGESFLVRFKSIIKDMRIYNLMCFCKKIAQQRKILQTIYLERANFYIETNNYERAELMFRKAILTAPKAPYPYIAFGEYFQEIQNDLPEAEMQFRQALRVSPRAYKDYLDFGLYCQERGRYLEAEEVFKNAVALSPKHPQAYALLGILYSFQGKTEDAEAILKESSEKFPKDYPVVLALGILYRTQGKYKEAQEHLKRVIAMYPKNTRLYVELSRSYLAQKDFVQAEAVLKRALKIKPKDELTYIELAWLEHAQNNEALAKEYFRHVLNMKPGSEDVLNMLAKDYCQSDKYVENESFFSGLYQNIQQHG